MLITLKRLPLGETSGHDETEGSGDINVCALFATHFKTTPNIPPMKKKQKKASQLLIRSATLSVCNKLLWRRARNWTQGEGGLCFRTQVSKQIWNEFGNEKKGEERKAHLNIEKGGREHTSVGEQLVKQWEDNLPDLIWVRRVF